MAKTSISNSESTPEVAEIVAPVSSNCSIISTVDHPVGFTYGGQNIRVSPREKISNLDKNLLPSILPKGLRVIA